MNRYLEPLLPYLDELRFRWESLEPERQRQIRLGAIAAGVLLPLILLLVPLVSGRLAAHAELESAHARLEEMQQLERRLREQGLNEQEQRERLPTRDESLLSLVDSVAQKVGIGPRVKSMRPVGQGRSEESEAVRVELNSLVLEEVVRFLYQIEIESPVLTVRRLELNKEVKTPEQLQASLEVAR